jgi:NADPH:quinone reductase-like Zn-dependent oxidoreductase
MKAVTFAEYGGPEVLQVTDVPEPEPGPGQIRIAVRAAGVNPLDWKVRSGAMSQFIPLELPAIDAREGAGVVDALGDGVDGVAVGDEVFGFTEGGAAAEKAILRAWAVKPRNVCFEEVAGLPVAVETSIRVFGVLGGVGAGDTIVIDGAAGGVGAIAVQLARARGARVIGTASEGNHEYLRGLGAEPTTYGDGLVARVRELAPDGVDFGFDTAGKGGVDALIELTGDPGRVASIADFGAAEKGVKVTSGGGAPPGPALEEAASRLADGSLQPPAIQAFPFSSAADAHRASEGGHVRGKLVLVPDSLS